MAALRKQIIPAVMSAGLDQGKDPKLVSQGLLKLENAICDKQGEFRKRLGLTSLTGTITEDDLAVHKDRVYLLGDRIRVVEGAVVSETPGLVYPTGYLDIDIQEVSPYLRGRQIESCEVASYGNILAISMKVVEPVSHAIAYELLVFDSRSMRTIDQLTGSDADIGQIRVMPTATGLVAVHPLRVASDWYPQRRVISAAGVIGAPTQFTACGASLASPSGLYFDAVMLNETGPVYMVTHQLVTTDYIEVIIHDSGTDYVRTNAFSGAVLMLKGCYRQSNTVGVVMAYVTGTPKVIRARGCSKTGFSGAAGTVYSFAADDEPITATGYATAAATSVVYVGVMRDALTDSSATETKDTITYQNTFNSTTAAVGTAMGHIAGVWPIAKPLIDASRIYLPVAQQGSNDGINRALLLVDADGGHWGRILEDCIDNLGGVPGSSYIDNCANVDGMLFAAPKKNGQASHAVAICQASRSGQIKGISTPHSLMVPGAAPLDFDGVRASEQGFWHYPRGIAAALHATGGATGIGTGTYGYCALYEYYDSNGQRHRSAPCEVVSLAVGAEDEVLVTVPTLKNTSKYTVVYIVLYRTAVDLSIYYRLTQALNDGGSEDVHTFTDQAADSAITAGEAVYTMGGVLENMPPPAYRVSCVHQDRQFIAARATESWDIRYSKQFTEGDGVAFNEALSIVCTTNGGRITALASFGDRLIIFKEEKIFASDGTALSDVGQGKGYSTPYLISEAVGCTNQKALTEIPQGLLFQGTGGLYLLDKTLNVSLISDPIAQDFSAATIMSAATVAAHAYAIFVAVGSALVYDYKHGLWSTFTRHEATDVCVADELYVLDGVNGLLRKQNAVHYDLEGATAFAAVMKIRTGWFSFAQLMGFQRLYKTLLLGQNVSHHQLRIKEAYNFDPVWVEERVFDSGARQTQVDGAAASGFGYSTDVDGQWMAVGMPDAEVGGSVRMFRRLGNRWVAQGDITPTDLSAGDKFGWSVRTQRNRVVIGAPQHNGTRGAVYVYKWTSAALWELEQKIIASSPAVADVFGYSVDIDGSRIVVGAPGRSSSAGRAFAFAFSTTWTLTGSLIGSSTVAGDSFGYSVAISGTSILVGVPFYTSAGGRAYVFLWTTAWAQQGAALQGLNVDGDDFGISCDIDGDRAIVGAPYTTATTKLGKAFIYERTGATWSAGTAVTPSDGASTDNFGMSVRIDGDWVAVGAPGPP